MTCNIFSVIRFSHENSSHYEQNDGFNFRYNDATLKRRDSQILGVYRDILRDVTKYILVFSFFHVFFVSVESDLKLL